MLSLALRDRGCCGWFGGGVALGSGGAQPPTRRLRFETALLFVDGRRRGVLQADHVIQDWPALVKLALTDPSLTIKRACHLEPMPVRIIGNNRRIVFA